MLPPETRFSVAVSDAERLDRFLADQLQVSRTVAARLIAERCVRISGDPARPSLEPTHKTEIVIVIPGAPPRQVVPAHIPLNVVYEDDELAVIDKPAGLVVHPAPGHWDDTLVNALAARGLNLAGGDEDRPGIVHRLDKDTSGLLVVAKTARAHEKLGKALAARKIQRKYAALTWGHLGAEERRIDADLARHPNDRKRMTVLREATGRGPHRSLPLSGVKAKHAATIVKTVARGGVADLVRCTLETGRTHQIRVHLSSIGHPVVGDETYGGTEVGRSDSTRKAALTLVQVTPRQALHAAWLILPHPATGESLELRSEWPSDLLPALAQGLGSPELLAETKPLQYLGFFDSGEPT
ncbi:MAG TPA: RluA family pseudouridine synthase [Gemmatimonadales bacterium]|jgi:23S rRNA pseudouridine1911/1915/1917 synthase